MTIIHSQMIAAAINCHGVIVARRSRCGRYITYQVDTGPTAPPGAVLAADCDDVVQALSDAGDAHRAGPLLLDRIQAARVDTRI